MADKIRRFILQVTVDGRKVDARHVEDENGSVINYTDHQAAMREAVGLLRGVYTQGEESVGALLWNEIDAFLSAHQECGGGGE